jgi:hypothetical protein
LNSLPTNSAEFQAEPSPTQPITCQWDSKQNQTPTYQPSLPPDYTSLTGACASLSHQRQRSAPLSRINGAPLASKKETEHQHSRAPPSNSCTVAIEEVIAPNPIYFTTAPNRPANSNSNLYKPIRHKSRCCGLRWMRAYALKSLKNAG